MTTELTRYDAACRALAEAVAIDEVKDIRDQAMAMACYARQAKNRDLEAGAVALRMRAVRRLAQLMQAQKEAVGLSKGGRPAKTGLAQNPVLATLAMQGIDKNLAHQARQLGALSEQEFEQKVHETRAAVMAAGGKVVKSKRQGQGGGRGKKKTSSPIGGERSREAVDDTAPKEETVTVRDDVGVDSGGEADDLRVRVKELQDENLRLKSTVEELRAKLATATGDDMSISEFLAKHKQWEETFEAQRSIIAERDAKIAQLQNENSSLRAGAVASPAAPLDDPRDAGPIPASLDRTRQGVAP